MAGLRRKRIAIAGHADQRGGHRIDDAVAVGLGDRHPFGIVVLRRLGLEFLDVAVVEHDPHLSVLLRLMMVEE